MNLRRLYLINALVFGIIGLVMAVSLMVFTDHIRVSADRIEVAIRSVHAAEKLQIALLSYDRELGFHVQDLSDLKAFILRSLQEVGENIDTAEEQRLYEEVAKNIKTYLAVSPESRRRHLILTDESLDKLVRVNIQQSEDLQTQIQRSQWFSDTIGVASLIFLLISGIVTAVLQRRFLARPLTRLHDTLQKFSAAPFSPMKAEVRGVQEIQDISNVVNTMSETLIRQRESRFKVLAAIAHDLRNPLNGIKMSVDLLSESSDEKDRAEMIEIVQRQAEHLNRLVGDLLDTTRIEAGDILLEPQHLDLREPAREAVLLFKNTSENHTLKLQIPEAPVPSNCDPLRISQVLNNLLSNAIKYSPKGGLVEVKVASDGAWALLEVSDQGIGISEEDAANIFEPFHRTSATREAFPGVGLGLSAARKIIEAHQGSITVSSKTGAGTCFKVTLPLAEVQ